MGCLAAVPQVATTKELQRLHIGSLVFSSYNAFMVRTRGRVLLLSSSSSSCSVALLQLQPSPPHLPLPERAQ